MSATPPGPRGTAEVLTSPGARGAAALLCAVIGASLLWLGLRGGADRTGALVAGAFMACVALLLAVGLRRRPAAWSRRAGDGPGQWVLALGDRAGLAAVAGVLTVRGAVLGWVAVRADHPAAGRLARRHPGPRARRRGLVSQAW